MCTLIVINHFHKEFPLILAANRDEYFYKKSSPVQILSNNPLIIGGKDDVKGGTWLAVNDKSIFAGVTNQGNNNKKPKSRGNLVLDVLKLSSIEEIIDFLNHINVSFYNDFNLVFGNTKKVYIAHSYLLNSIVIRELPHGVHTIYNDMHVYNKSIKSEYIHSILNKKAQNTSWLNFYKLLKSTLNNKDHGLLVKKKNDFCTLSSSILAFSEEGLERYKFFDRTIKRLKNLEREELNQEFNHKYSDYIDLWRNENVLSKRNQFINLLKAKYEQ